MNNKNMVGKFGEDKSAEYLENNDYEVINRNYYCKFGEIDIIAVDKKTSELVFIEVKTRTNLSYGMPIEAINKQKIKHMKKSINHYIVNKNILNWDIRIDAIEVLIKEKTYYIHHIKRIL